MWYFEADRRIGVFKKKNWYFSISFMVYSNSWGIWWQRRLCKK